MGQVRGDHLVNKIFWMTSNQVLGGAAPWVPDEECQGCTSCDAAFSLLNRRHHCRICGQIFCEPCTKARLTNVHGRADSVPHRIWYHTSLPNQSDHINISSDKCCERLLEENLAAVLPSEPYHSQGFLCGLERSPAGPLLACTDPEGLRQALRMGFGLSMQLRSESYCSDTSSTLDFCPVCSKRLTRLGKETAQKHVSDCLDAKRSSIIGNRYTGTIQFYLNILHIILVVCKLELDVPGKECGICFETFEAGNEVAVLNCLCQFHKGCIDKWLAKGKACPFHYAA